MKYMKFSVLKSSFLALLLFCSVTLRSITVLREFYSQLDREKEAELIKAKAAISELEMKVQTLETSRKWGRIEYEKDMQNVRSEFQVWKLKVTYVSDLYSPELFIMSKNATSVQVIWN